ncbi:hypothetical protein FRC03_008036, partial [Tulasnella sp. 419]
MVSWRSLLAVLPLIGAAYAQTSQVCDTSLNMCFENYDEPLNGAKIGFLFPSCNTANEFIGQWTVPISAKWYGLTLGPGMNRNLLVVAWPNGNTIVHSLRVSENYAYPPVTTGPTITTISSSVTATQWKWTFRCQGCTSWNFQSTPGAIVQDGISVFGWAYSSNAVANPASASSTFTQHTSFSE